jgi:hypothetical protein
MLLYSLLRSGWQKPLLVLCLLLLISPDTSAQKRITIHPIKANQKKIAKIPKQDRIDLAIKQEFELTKDPATNTLPRERLIAARAYQQQEFARQSQLRAVPGLQWQERGPTNIGGRTRALIFDRSDLTNRRVWAGSVGGGLWRCNDITAVTPVWTRVDDLLPNLAISTLAQHPVTTSTMFAGTGEGWFNFDAIQGAGIYRTTNGGATWTILPSTAVTPFNIRFRFVQKIVVKNDGTIFAATRDDGLQRSTDGGNTWIRVLGAGTGGSANLRAADVEIAANGFIYCSLGIVGTDGIYRSTDNGATWTKIYTSLADEQRIELACAPSDANYVYALVQRNTSDIKKVMRTTNATVATPTWATLVNPTGCMANTGAALTDFTNGQAWYNLIAAVDPANRDIVMIGGLDIYRTTNGGVTSWTQASRWVNAFCAPLPVVHADIHAIAYANSSRAIIGNDGGVYITNDGGNTFTSKNNSYNVTQFYSTAIHPTATNTFLAGSQDNGTHRFTAAGLNATTEVTGGDGGFCHIDQNNPNFQLSSFVFNNYFRSTTGGAPGSWTQTFFGNFGSFINPTDFDNASDFLYGCSNAGQYFRWLATGAAAANVTVPAFGGATVTHVMVANSVANRVYFGLNNGSVIRIDNANGAAPTSKTLRPATPALGSVSCIAIDPNSATEDRLLVTYSNYGVTSVWLTTDANSAVTPTWASREGDLPDMPVRWAMFDPRSSNWAIIATELGVWSTDDLSIAFTDWEPTNNNLANVRTDMLQYRASDKLIAAATHGRGLFTTLVPADLYVRDDIGDVGIEPNPLPSGVFWNSPDIWVCNTLGAACTSHQNPIGSNPNFVRVQITNRGSLPSTGSEILRVYWAKASMSLDWPNAWSPGAPFFCGTQPKGGTVGSAAIPAGVPPGGTTIVTLNWIPPDPSNYACFGTDKSHFCLLARIETASTTPFGMTFPETTDLYNNVKNNNNIAWRNVSIIDLNPSGAGRLSGATSSTIGNTNVITNNGSGGATLDGSGGNVDIINELPGNTSTTNTTVLLGGPKFTGKSGDYNNLAFAIPEEEGDDNVLRYGDVIVDLGDYLAGWLENGAQGQGIELFESRTNPGKQLIRILTRDAIIYNLRIADDQIGSIGIDVIQKEIPADYDRPRVFDLALCTKDGFKGDIAGGETFEILFARELPVLLALRNQSANLQATEAEMPVQAVVQSSKQISAQVTGSNKTYQAELWDITGRKLLTRNFINTVHIDGAQWPDGVYLLRITDVQTRKFIVKKLKL